MSLLYPTIRRKRNSFYPAEPETAQEEKRARQAKPKTAPQTPKPKVKSGSKKGK